MARVAGKPWRRRCPWCDQIAFMRKSQIYCSYSCARYGQTIGRDDAWIRQNARHAGLVSGALARAAARQRYEQLAASLSPADAWRQGYEKGYAAGYARAAYGKRTVGDPA